MSDFPSARLEPICHADAQLAERLALPDTPVGTRVIIEVVSLRLEGPRLRASLTGRAAADWAIVAPGGGMSSLDVRCTVRTDDGALIFIQYNGRMRFADDDPSTAYVAPRFETGDSRYAWLNPIQGVGKGLFDPATRRLRYAFYELI